MSENVFADLGFGDPELELQQADANLRIGRIMRANNLTAAHLSKLGVSVFQSECLWSADPCDLSLAELQQIESKLLSSLPELKEEPSSGELNMRAATVILGVFMATTPVGAQFSWPKPNYARGLRASYA